MSTYAEIFPPGEFLRDELEARNWTQTEFAEIIGRPVRLVNEIISGKKSITPETALQLSASLGTSPELWMNLESQYQLSKVRKTNTLIERKASLYGRFPVRDKRGTVDAAARALVEKIDAIHASPDYEAVWTMAAHRGMPYRGPDYSGELQALRAALERSPVK